VAVIMTYGADWDAACAQRAMRARSRDVNEDTVTDADVRQPARLGHPTADSAGIAIDFSGEGLKIAEIGEEIRF
jgi:hypothetical protein